MVTLQVHHFCSIEVDAPDITECVPDLFWSQILKASGNFDGECDCHRKVRERVKIF